MSIWAPRVRLRILLHHLHTNSPGWERIKQYKYPTTNPDPEIFERAKPQHLPVSKNFPPLSTVDALVQYVRDGDLDAAQRIRNELVEMGAVIPKDMIYEKAAVHIVLHWPNPSNHVETFVNWLDLLPDAQFESSHEREFEQLRESLLVSPSQHLVPLIVQFGFVCMAKGYEELVRTQVVPAVRNLVSAKAYRRFLRDLINRKARYKYRLSPAPALIRIPPKDVVLKPIPPPLPPLIDEFSCFEAITDEYHTPTPTPQPSSTLTTPQTIPLTTPQALISLIESEKFPEASQLLTEMLDIGIPIPPSIIYEKAALASLNPSYYYSTSTSTQQKQHPPPTQQHQLNEFTRWFSLIPNARSMGSNRKFYAIRRRLFLAKAPNLMLIIRFATICAQKGYAKNVYWFVFPPLMRYADAQVCRRFMKEFEAAHRAWQSEVLGVVDGGGDDGGVLAKYMRTMRKAWRTVAVRNLAISGREELAVELLPSEDAVALGEELPLPAEICTLLVTRLRSRVVTNPGDVKAKELLDKVKSSFRNALEVDYMQYEYPPVLLQSESAVDGLAAKLRFLKSSITSNQPIHTRLLVNTISTYLSTGRTRALTLLRAKALRCKDLNIARDFMFGEMVYYQRKRLYEMVVVTFWRWFWVVGVPRDEVLGRLVEWGVIDSNDGEGEGYGRQAKHGKLYPTPYHTSLVWHALVGLTKNRVDLEALYAKLLAYAQGSPAEDPSSPSLSPPPSWPHRISDSAFVPFIRMFNVRFGPTKGVKVLSDMQRVGLKPGIYQYTEVAGRYARLGDVGRAWMILERLERDRVINVDDDGDGRKGGGDVDGDEDMRSMVMDVDMQMQEEQPPSQEELQIPEEEQNSIPPPPPLFDFPPPNIVFMSSMLRGFVEANCIEGARRLVKHMKEKYHFEAEKDERLGRVLAAYEELEESVAVQKAQPANGCGEMLNIRVMPGSMVSLSSSKS